MLRRIKMKMKMKMKMKNDAIEMKELMRNSGRKEGCKMLCINRLGVGTD